MRTQTQRMLTLLFLVSPILIAGILTKNLTLDILPIIVVAVFACWVAIRSKHPEKKEKL
jgi:hypothetical protein